MNFSLSFFLSAMMKSVSEKRIYVMNIGKQLGWYTWIEPFLFCIIVVDILSEINRRVYKGLLFYKTLILLYDHVYVSDICIQFCYTLILN